MNKQEQRERFTQAVIKGEVGKTAQLHPQIEAYVVRRIKIEESDPELDKISHLKVSCVHCQDYFIVPLTWIKSCIYRTRPCPNCFKTSWVPDKLPPRK